MVFYCLCPFCKAEVDERDRSCWKCAAKLTKPKFKFTSLLIFSVFAVAAAFILSLVIIPLTIAGIIIALFAREKLHERGFSDKPPPAGKRVIDT